MSADFSVYIHVPFCRKKCPYCDFTSFAAPLTLEQDYLQALLKELEYYLAAAEWKEKECRTVYFGGGTPSLFTAGFFAAVLERLARGLSRFEPVEVTVEANPGTISEELDAQKLKDLRRAGVNRISLGAQSFSDRKLKFLGRIHAARDVYQAIDNIGRADFRSFGIDLITGTACETETEWESDLKSALSLAPPHIAAYELSIEKGTVFQKMLDDRTLTLPDERTRERLFICSHETLTGAGLSHYEISNYARPGCESLHNAGYWTGKNYLGLGAGASSFVQAQRSAGAADFGIRWRNVPEIDDYLRCTAADGTAVQSRETIDREKAVLEFFMLGLRTASGIKPADYDQKFGDDFFGRWRKTVTNLENFELLERHGDSLRVTVKGMLLLDSVVNAFAEET